MSDRILVTGASRGIGRAIAVRLAASGYELTLNYNQSRQAAAACLAQIRATGGQGHLLQFDVGDRAHTRAAIEADIAARGAYYGVVLNAGISRDQALPMMADDDWDAVLGTNLDGFYNVLKPALLPMIQRRTGGRIVVMSSVSGIIGNRGQTNYAASKAGLIGAAKSLALELAKRRITVNCVAPGLIETEMLGLAPVARILESIPMRRLGQASEVAELVGFLCSPDAAYITRQVIAVDGGLSGS